MSLYSYFAEYYDVLTVNVEYKKRAEYFLSLMQKHGHQAGLTLDLACGTGSLTLELSRKGVDIFGADASSDMLSVAQQKFVEEGRQILLLCQKMQDLELIGSIHTCICTLDSINHLPSSKDVIKTFEKVAKYLDQDGMLIFDCNTIYKHEHILGDNCYVYDTEEVFCVWQNHYRPHNHKVIITLDFFEPDGKTYNRYTEQFSERAYTRAEMEQMLNEAGLMTEAVYEDMSFEAPKLDTQREIYVVRKMNKHE